MPPHYIIAIVGISSFIHAGWNYMAKTIPAGNAVFVWWIAFLVAILYMPVVAWYVFYYNIQLSILQIGFLAATAIIHLFYFLCLQYGYQKSDLSVVYPIARGTGPMLSTLGAVWFLNEYLSEGTLAGLLFVLVGIFLVSGLPLPFVSKQHNSTLPLPDSSYRIKLQAGIFYGLLTGLLIAAYTLLDAYAVRQLKIPILLVEYVSHPFRVLMLLPLMLFRPQEVVELWQKYAVKLCIIALICPLPFILVLYALQYAPVGYVAPAREFSIVIGVFLGTKLLAEKNMYRRLVGSIIIILGIALLSWAKL